MTATLPTRPTVPHRPGFAALAGRALRLRCPSCGAGPVFQGWVRMVDRCPGCGLNLTRKESGYSLGGFWLNLLFAEGLTMALFIGTLVRTWPDPPWALLQYGLPLMALVSPVVFYPFSKTLFLALDLAVRPASHDERT